MIATTHRNVPVIIPQLWSEKDWLTSDAIKMAEQWDHLTGTTNTEGAGEIKIEGLLLAIAVYHEK